MPKIPKVDELTMQDLDTRVLGINERDDPADLRAEEGSYGVEAVNMRFRNSWPETRDGYIKPLQFQSERFHSPHSGIEGIGTFVDLSGQEWIAEFVIVAPKCEVRFVKMASWPQLTHTTVAAADRPRQVVFVQAGEEMVCFRANGEPLHWDGNFAHAWEASSVAKLPPETPAELQPLPPAPFGIWAGDRVWFPLEDGVGCTGMFEPRRWDPEDPLTSFFVIGGEGPVTGMIQWRLGTIIVFKETSVWALNEARGLLENLTLEMISDQAGCIAHKTVTQVGGTLMWLGRGGVYQLGEVLKTGPAGGLGTTRQLSPVPVSWPIPVTMGRVNWTAAARAVATLSDGLWYLALPVDGATHNNCLLVYDTVTGQWQGEDRLAWEPDEYRDLNRTVVFGLESPIVASTASLFAGGHGWHDGYGAGEINVEGVGFDIPSSFTSRGYELEETSLKTLKSMELVTEELGTADVSLTVRVDGQRMPQNVQLLQTRDRHKYLSWGRVDRNLANLNDNFDEPDREDYAWRAGQTQTETVTIMVMAPGMSVAGNIAVTLTGTGLLATLFVAVALGDNPPQIVPKIVAAWKADAGLSAGWNIYQSGAENFTIERKVPAPYDPDLNVTVADASAVGINPLPFSSETFAGDPAEDVLMLGESGVPLGVYQRHNLRGDIVGVQRYVEARVTASAGKLRIKAIRACGTRRPDLATRL